MNYSLSDILKHTLIYTAGSVFNRFLPFLLLPVYTYYFRPEDYGLYSLVYSLWFFIVLIYLFGSETAFQKMFLEAGSNEKKNIYSTIMLMILGVSVTLSLIIFVFSEELSLLFFASDSPSNLLRLLSILLVADSLSRFPMIVMNSEQRSVNYTLINAVAVIINVFLNLLFIILWGMGIESILYAYIVSYLFILFCGIGYTREYLSFTFSSDTAKTILRSSYLFFFYGVFLISIDLADRFIIEYMRGIEEVGIYSASYRLGIVMNLVITGFKIAWIPFFMKVKDYENSKELYSKVFTYFCYAGFSAFLFFSLLTEDVIKIKIWNYTFLNQDYWSGVHIIPYILGAYFFHGLFINLTVASFLENKTSYLLRSSASGCVVNIVLNLILIPNYGITGAAVSTLMSYITMFVVLYYLSQKIYYINYQWNRIITAFILTIFLFFSGFYISSLEDISYFYEVLIKVFLVTLLVIYLLRSQIKKYILKV